MPSVHSVALVLDPDFGERLRPLAERMHVWIVGTACNRQVAEMIWAEHATHSLEHGVTTMNPEGCGAPEGLFPIMLDEVDVHHGEYSHDPVWTVLHVYGVEPTDAVLAALAAYGATEIERTPDHFVATRAEPSKPQH